MLAVGSERACAPSNWGQLMAEEEQASQQHSTDRSDQPSQPPSHDGGSDAESSSALGRNRRPLRIVAIVVAVLGIAAFIFWFARRNQVSTDDAYTDGNVVTMAPKVSGYVVALYINDNTHVHKGDLLLRIDARDYLASEAQAEAQLALAQAQLKSAIDAVKIARVQYPAQLLAAQAEERSAEATLVNAQRQFRRQHEVNPLATTQENIDTSSTQQLTSRATLDNARAQVTIARLAPEQVEQTMDTVRERESQVKQAEAQLTQAELNVGYTELRAPLDGFVTMRSVHLGDFLAVGTTVFLLVTADVWVTANFKETQIGRMRVGDHVDITIDAFRGYRLEGHVESFQQGSGSRFSAFPAENATGNFVKIVQRIPVKIVIDRGLDPDRPLPLGLSVVPVVHFQ